MKRLGGLILRKETRCGILRGLLYCLTTTMAVALGIASVAWAAPFAYVTNLGTDSVSVVDVATNTVIATISVQADPSWVAITPNGTRAYVKHNSRFLSVINTASKTVAATIQVGNGSGGVAVTPDGARVYVANAAGNSVSVIDTATNTVTATVPVGNWPQGLAMTPDGTRVYVANMMSYSVSVIETAGNAVTATVPVAAGSFDLAVHPTGARVYVKGVSTVSVIETATHTVTATVSVGSGSGGVAVSLDGTRVYTANHQDNNVSVIDTATNSIVATIPTGVYPQGLAVTSDGAQLYVANYYSGSVSVIDTASNTQVATVGVGSFPFGVAISPPLSVISVAIDIKPGSYPNSINLGSGGTVPVAILGSATFDATTVDPLTVTLASAPVKLKGKGTPMAAIEDVNQDGLPDLVVHVSTEALELSETDTEAVLEGNTYDGMAITGKDSVRIVP